MLRNILSTGGITFLSRLTGLLRDILAARYIGAGKVMDSFIIAFRLPNMFRALIAEGAFHSSYVPFLTKAKAEHGKDAMYEVAGKIILLMAIILMAISLLLFVFVYDIIDIIARGSDFDKDLAAKLSFFTIPYVFLVGMVSVATGMLHVKGKFAFSAFLPIVLNISMATFLFIGHRLYDNTEISAQFFAIGFLVGGIIQLILAIYYCFSLQVIATFSLKNILSVWRSFLSKMLPATLGSGVYQINVVISSMLASYVVGANSWLNYADRIYQLPLGVIGIAASTVFLPQISQTIAQNNLHLAIKQQNYILTIIIAISIPSLITMLIFGDWAIEVLFSSNKFTSLDVSNTQKALAAYAIALPMAMSTRIFTALFYARSNPKVPMISSFIAVFIFVTLSIVMMTLSKKFWTIALASSISIAMQTMILFIILYKRKLWQVSSSFIKNNFFTLSAAICYGIIIFVGKNIALNIANTRLEKLLALIIICGIAALVWLVIIYKTKAFVDTKPL